jgi:hypothetical protein
LIDFWVPLVIYGTKSSRRYKSARKISVSLTDVRAGGGARFRFHQHRAALAAKGENDDQAYFVGSLVDCIGVRAMTLLRLAGNEFRFTSLARSASESMFVIGI